MCVRAAKLKYNTDTVNMVENKINVCAKIAFNYVNKSSIACQ